MRKDKTIQRLMLAAVLVFISSLSPCYSQTDSKPAGEMKEVIAEGEALLGDDTTPAQARAMARNNAMRNALEQAVGVNVQSSTVLYNSSLISDLVVTATKGLIVKDEKIEDGPVVRGDKIYHVYKLRAFIKPVNIEKRGNFRIVKAEVVRAGSDRGLKNPVFQENDEIQVHISANEDSYIRIFSISQDGTAAQLYPNTYFKSEQLAAHKTMIFPDDVQRALGLKLRVRTPKKLNTALESILVIAAKEKIELLPPGGLEELMLTDLLRELSEIDPSLWADKTVGYEVRK